MPVGIVQGLTAKYRSGRMRLGLAGTWQSRIDGHFPTVSRLASIANATLRYAALPDSSQARHRVTAHGAWWQTGQTGQTGQTNHSGTNQVALEHL